MDFYCHSNSGIYNLKELYLEKKNLNFIIKYMELTSSQNNVMRCCVNRLPPNPPKWWSFWGGDWSEANIGVGWGVCDGHVTIGAWSVSVCVCDRVEELGAG